MISKKTRWCLIVILALSALGLMVIASLGAYDRPQNDDYFFLAKDGPFSHDNFNWRTNGRIGSLVAYYILYPIPHILQISPALTLLLLVVSLTLFMRSILKLQMSHSNDIWLVAAAIACSISLGISFMLPGLYSSFFWFAAVPPHTWSFCLAVLYIGLLINRLQQKKGFSFNDFLLFFLLPCIVSTFYEASALIVFVASACAAVYAFGTKSGRPIRLTSALSTVAAVAAFTFLLLSPGGSRRRSLNSGQNDNLLSQLLHLPAVIWHNYTFTLPRYLQHPELLLVFFAAGTLVGIFLMNRAKLSVKRAGMYATFVTLASLIFVTVDMCVVWMGLNESQTVREYFSLVLGFSTGVFLLGVILGQYLSCSHDKFKRSLLATAGLVIPCLIILVHLAYIPDLLNFRNGIISYSSVWDGQDRQIRLAVARKNCLIPTTGIAINGLWHAKQNRNYWVNKDGMSYYYGVKKLGPNCSIYAKKIVRPFGERILFEDPRG